MKITWLIEVLSWSYFFSFWEDLTKATDVWLQSPKGKSNVENWLWRFSKRTDYHFWFIAEDDKISGK